MEHQFSLKSYNTFGIEVKAKHYATFSSVEELRILLQHPIVQNERRLILGGGSNMLFKRDFNGVVLHNKIKGIELMGEDDNHYIVRAAAGEIWHEFVMHCIDKNWAGLENLSLIPGCVGASPMQNIGAYGVEIKDVFHSLEAISIADGSLKVFHAEECAFGYRESIFKQKEKDKWVITSVSFRLTKRPEFKTTYGAIQEELDKMILDKLTIKAISQAVINIRKSKLPDPMKIGNAGSFFKNPVVPVEVYERIKLNYPDVPVYPVSPISVKIPAGWLIEKAGWKGKRIGNYGVHDKQALVIVNYGGATGSELYQLSSDIIADIETKFGVTLEREVNMIG